MDSEIRKIELPEKDQPLREDVSLLGSLVGEMLVDQHGVSLLELVEQVRKASIRNRESANSESSELEELLGGLDDDQVHRLIHAFSTYLRAVNLAEKVHRIRRRRVYQRAEAEPQSGSLEDVFRQLRSDGFNADKISEAINQTEILPIFTAHPTEATRRTILEKEYDIVLRLVERLNPELTPREEQLAIQRIRAAITSAWQTRLEPHSKPTVADEFDNILFYLTEILYRVVPAFYDVLEKASQRHLGHDQGSVSPDPILRCGSWVGGDMDGNPNVTSRTILDTLGQQRKVIIGRYVREVGRLARYLSQSLSEISVSTEVLDQVTRYRKLLPHVDRELPERYADMPYRCLLLLVQARLKATLAGENAAYETTTEFTGDVAQISQSLLANKGRHAGQFGVDRLMCRIRTFGFHLATLDVRQDALLHRRVTGELLGEKNWESFDARRRADRLAKHLAEANWPQVPDTDQLSEEASETLDVFRAISSARNTFGPAAIGMFIISMAQGADDVLTVLALNEMANGANDSTLPLEVTPLLETVQDLDAGPAILGDLLKYGIYQEHLRKLQNRQTIMVGYSDSSKDSGIVSSRWALYQAQRELVRAGESLDVSIRFFHGRGGTVSRGGGNLVNGILGAPPGTVGGYLRMTEQGEVINQKYGVRFLALRNLELVTGATISHSLGSNTRAFNEEESLILSNMATLSRKTFKDLVYGDQGFPVYFRAATPLDVIERLNIGSRPASRRSGQGIENLRAIPWVFSWAQTRMGFPGVYGFGTAINAAIGEFGIERLRQLLDEQVFFRAMINDVEMVLAKSELELGQRYANLAEPGQRHYFDLIREEFDLATRSILELKRVNSLLDDQRVLQRNIRLRNPYVDPIHLLQIDLLHRWRAGGRENESQLNALKATVKGIALGIQNTG